MPRINAEQKAASASFAINSDDTMKLTRLKDYTISFAASLEHLHIEVAGKRFTFTPEELAAALGS